jgi:enoyl-CoA hydratase
MEYLHFEKTGDVGLLLINRPLVLNALNRQLLQELLDFVTIRLLKEGCKALIVSGSGDKAFIAGADIKEMQEFNPQEMLAFCALGQQVTLALENAPLLTLAAVNGYALGGGLELALACDFIYASKYAKMGLPEVSLGIIPGFGGNQRLSQAVGTRVAKELIMSGRTLSAEEAKVVGIVNKVCEGEVLLQECQLTAREVARHSLQAIVQAKRAINCGYSMNIYQALELERNMCAVCFGTEDRVQGMANFLEKRNKG